MHGERMKFKKKCFLSNYRSFQ